MPGDGISSHVNQMEVRKNALLRKLIGAKRSKSSEYNPTASEIDDLYNDYVKNRHSIARAAGEVKKLLVTFDNNEDIVRIVNSALRDRGLCVVFSEAAAEVDQDLPTVAPCLWADRDRSKRENPAQFLGRVYEPWHGKGDTWKGLTRKHINQLDPRLYEAFATYVHRHGAPAHYDLPSRKEVNARMLQTVSPEQVRAAQRLSSLVQRYKTEPN